LPSVVREPPYRVLVVLGLILAAGIGLRITLVTTTDHTHLLSGDAYEYYRYSLNLKRCGIYSPTLESITGDCSHAVADNHRRPAYPLFLFPFAEWPPTLAMMREIQWAQIGIAAIGIMLTGFAFVLLGRGAALMAALFMALSPHLAVTSLNFLTENIFSALLLVFASTVVAWFRWPGAALSAAVGATLALPLLVRSTTAYLVFIIVPFLAWSAPRRRFPTAGIMAAAYLICLAPWFIASHTLLSPRDGPSLMLTTVHNGSYIDLTVPGDPESRGRPHQHDPGYAGRDTLAKVFAYTRDRAMADPGAYLRWYLIDKPRMFFSWSVVAGFGDVFVFPVRFHGYASNLWLHLSHTAMWYLHWPVMIIALIVAVAAFLPRSRLVGGDPVRLGVLRMLAIVIAYFVALHIVGTPLPRYSVPILPFVYLLAGVGLESGLRAGHEKLRTFRAAS